MERSCPHEERTQCTVLCQCLLQCPVMFAVCLAHAAMCPSVRLSVSTSCQQITCACYKCTPSKSMRSEERNIVVLKGCYDRPIWPWKIIKYSPSSWCPARLFMPSTSLLLFFGVTPRTIPGGRRRARRSSSLARSTHAKFQLLNKTQFRICSVDRSQTQGPFAEKSRN